MDSVEIVQGRPIGPAELALIGGLLRDHPDWNRTRISRELCRLWDWRDAGGRMKDMACRTLLLKLQRRGRIELPAQHRGDVNHCRSRDFEPVLHDRSPILADLQELLPIRWILADKGPQRLLWQTLIDLYHYLGFKTRVGKSLCYLAVDRAQRPVGCLLFGAAAWKVAPRDRFIGWSEMQRRNHLHQVVNNMRFLIPPWVQVRHLASHLLSGVTRRLPGDWIGKYGHPVCLAESFVEVGRFSGSCYRAANWVHVGTTQGRSRNDVHKQLSVPPKAIYVRPLARDFRRQLTED